MAHWASLVSNLSRRSLLPLAHILRHAPDGLLNLLGIELVKANSTPFASYDWSYKVPTRLSGLRRLHSTTFAMEASLRYTKRLWLESLQVAWFWQVWSKGPMIYRQHPWI